MILTARPQNRPHSALLIAAAPRRPAQTLSFLAFFSSFALILAFAFSPLQPYIHHSQHHPIVSIPKFVSSSNESHQIIVTISILVALVAVLANAYCPVMSPRDSMMSPRFSSS